MDCYGDIVGYLCMLCNNYCDNTINLRTGELVCKTCIQSRESQIAYYRNKINELNSRKPPENVWDFFRKIEIIAFIILGLYVFILTGAFEISFIVWVIGICLSVMIGGVSENKKTLYKKSIQSQIEQIKKEMEQIQVQLRDIYKEFWDYPPDWKWRRKQIIQRDGGCKRCGASINSELVFHVHHIINKDEVNGNHSLDNLVLRCELCHSKEPGHDLIRRQRKNIKKTRVSRIYY